LHVNPKEKYYPKLKNCCKYQPLFTDSPDDGLLISGAPGLRYNIFPIIITIIVKRITIVITSSFIKGILDPAGMLIKRSIVISPRGEKNSNCEISSNGRLFRKLLLLC